MTEPQTADPAPTSHEQALRDELGTLVDQAQQLTTQLATTQAARQRLLGKLAALLAPYPVGTLVEECYLRGYGMARHEGHRRWRLEQASFRYGTTLAHLSYEALLVKKDGTPGVTRQRIAASTLLAGSCGENSTTTWRVVEETP